MKRILLTLSLLALVATTGMAQTYEEWLAQNNADFGEFRELMLSGVANDSVEYEAYRTLFLEELNAFKDEMEAKWGEFKQNTEKEWVEYLEGGDTKLEVDFETGDVTIEVIVENPEDVNVTQTELPEKVASAIKSQGTQLGFVPEKLPNPPVVEAPVLQNQLPKEENETDEEFAEKVVEQTIETKTISGKDGVERTVLRVNFTLAPNHIQTRAEKISDLVYEFSFAYKLDPSMVFAVIHTESYFNPVASSPANAFGLMQLVPTSGGRDAYRKVNKKDGIPTKDFLFNPRNNINLGCAYFEILFTSYFKDVQSDLSRSYMAISAYNTGAGNVYKAYDPNNRSKRAALSEIAKRTDKENYDFLVENLPYEETRSYLQKVVSRAELYKGWAEE
tara:strand:+ start:61741 stop:62910 length:1170 start_codon:yes stop_codon:yes gene_type:complete